ncbi:hypothetical protein [Vibrio sp. YIC-376]|uniref:hypothetical protein n=1 Tax=Vibrio sp. YIC-376 TaxID=3136162 RepID=UPI00402A6955
MLLRFLAAFSILLVFSNVAYTSTIYTCKSGDSTVFQDTPCAEDYDYGIKEIDTFDGWKYGMNILAVKKQSKLRKLPINPGQTILTSQFNARLLDSNSTARIYTYSSVIAGNRAKVMLFFTQRTQKLYKIKASFIVAQLPIEEKQYFYSSLVNQLTLKYGSYLEAKNYPKSSNVLTKIVLKDLVGTEKVWGANSDNVVSLTGNRPFNQLYELSYKYLPLLKQSLSETTQEIQESTEKAMIRDADKLQIKSVSSR